MSRLNEQNAASFLHFIPDELSMSIVPSCMHISAIGNQRTAFLTFIPHDTALTPYIYRLNKRVHTLVFCLRQGEKCVIFSADGGCE